MLKYVLPKLGSHLRTHLAINPRAQSLAPLEEALKWKDILRSSMMSQLLEGEFVGKWLDVLYIWLVSPKPNFDEVTQWSVLATMHVVHRDSSDLCVATM